MYLYCSFQKLVRIARICLNCWEMYSADTGSWGPQDRSNTIQDTFTNLHWARMMTLCPCVQCLATVSWGFHCNLSGNDCVRLARQLPARPEAGYQLNTESRLEAPAVRGPPVRSEASDGPGHCRHLGWGGGLGGIWRPTMGRGGSAQNQNLVIRWPIRTTTHF